MSRGADRLEYTLYLSFGSYVSTTLLLLRSVMLALLHSIVNVYNSLSSVGLDLLHSEHILASYI